MIGFLALAAIGFGCTLLSNAVDPPANQTKGPPAYFYQKLEYGSESQFNPITSLINYSLDPLQVRESFDDERFGPQLREVWGNLTDPGGAIDEEGGTKNFINRQIFPVDFDHLDESKEMIPNYALHLIGGGMVYRKNVEWFQAHHYRFPRIYAATLGMAAEFLQEVVEKKSTSADDEIADFYIYRPAGMLLFSWDPVARFASEKLRLREWAYQPMYNVRRSEFENVGENYLIRPPIFGEAHSPFIYFGLTTLAGWSHQITATDRLSWGAGAAVENASRRNLGLRPSGGLFYDRHDSLLASVLFNGTENLAMRLNVYPGAIVKNKWFPGIYLGVGDGGEISVGLTIRLLPLGLSGNSK